MNKKIIWLLLALIVILALLFFGAKSSSNPQTDGISKTELSKTDGHDHKHQSAPSRPGLTANILSIFSLFNRTDESVWQRWVDSALEDVNCPSPPVRDWYPSSYKGKLIDAHIHIASIPDDTSGVFDGDALHPTLGANLKIGDLVCMMDTEGTSKVFAFFPVWEPIIGPSIEIVKRTMEKYPGRFVPFIMPPERDDHPKGFPTVNAETLSKMLAIEPELFQGFGEIGLYERKGGAPALPPDSKRLQEIYPVVRANKLLIYFHLGEGQKEPLEKVAKANRDINFIFHGDQLVKYEDGGRQNLSKIDEILTNNPNVFYEVDELYGDDFLLRPEVSKEQFVAHFKNYEPLLKEDLGTWKKFIEKHQDQVIWGTDRGWSSAWSVAPDVALVLNRYSRAFIGRLPPGVQEKYAYKNAEKILGLAGVSTSTSPVLEF